MDDVIDPEYLIYRCTSSHSKPIVCTGSLNKQTQFYWKKCLLVSSKSYLNIFIRVPTHNHMMLMYKIKTNSTRSFPLYSSCKSYAICTIALHSFDTEAHTNTYNENYNGTLVVRRLIFVITVDISALISSCNIVCQRTKMMCGFNEMMCHRTNDILLRIFPHLRLYCLSI